MPLLLAAAALVVASCGGGDATTTTTVPSGTASPTTTVGPPGQPVVELDVQGHRGARGLKPEETLPSFEAALDLGVTTLELDLHFTSDDQVVIWHDAAIDDAKCGLAVGAPTGLPDPDDPLVPTEQLMIRNLTSGDLSWYRCDRNPDPARYPEQDATATALAGENWSIVTLDALFEFVAAYAASPEKTAEQRAAASVVRFNIETKRKPDQPETIADGFDGSAAGPFELEILATVADRGLGDRVVIQSFDHRSLWAVAALDPDIELAALSTRQAVDYADLAARGASIWSPNQDAVNADSLTRAHAAGLDVIPWTVNDRKDMEELISLGVDGIITDRPDILVDLIGAN